MPDEMDLLQNYNDERNADALAEHQRRMADMEMIEPNEDDVFECDDCGVKLSKVTRNRLKYPMLLCGECFEFHKHSMKPTKMRDGYE